MFAPYAVCMLIVTVRRFIPGSISCSPEGGPADRIFVSDLCRGSGAPAILKGLCCWVSGWLCIRCLVNVFIPCVGQFTQAHMCGHALSHTCRCMYSARTHALMQAHTRTPACMCAHTHTLVAALKCCLFPHTCSSTFIHPCEDITPVWPNARGCHRNRSTHDLDRRETGCQHSVWPCA